jgi:hypothetical protein
MRKDALQQFIGVLKSRLAGQENSLGTLETQAISRDTTVNDLLKAISQAHINELEFVIEELEQILEAD